MTNEQEKSDLVIVAIKLANVGDRAGSRQIQGRGTEGNPGGATHVPDTEPGKRLPEARQAYEVQDTVSSRATD